MYWINSCWQCSSLKYEIQIASWTCHLSHWNEWETTTCSTSRKSHKFRFELSNCYNNIIDFHVIYGDMKSIFMEHPFDVHWSTGSNLKCIFMHAFFASLLSRYTTMRVCREIYSCAEYFFPERATRPTSG